MPKHDRSFMRQAMALAQQAGDLGEVPVGALVVRGGQVIATGINRREGWGDPTAHAEVVAVRRASEVLGSWRLEGCTVFVTLEPCPMCAGALVGGRVERLVYGAADAKGGAVRSLYAMVDDPRLNHRMRVDRCMIEECGVALSAFFAGLRQGD